MLTEQPQGCEVEKSCMHTGYTDLPEKKSSKSPTNVKVN